MKSNTKNFYSADVFDRSLSACECETAAKVAANDYINYINNVNSSLNGNVSSYCCSADINTNSSDATYDSIIELKNRVSVLEELISESESKSKGIELPLFNTFRSRRRDFATLRIN